MPKVLVTNGIPMEGFAAPRDFELLYPGAGKAFAREELLALLPDVDAVLACSALDREMIQAASQLKLIVCYGAGYDSIDLQAATAKGIPVANTPDAVTEVTAELAIAMMLSLVRRLPELNERMHQDEPSQAFGLGKNMGLSLKGMTLGIVGMGRIGGRVADFGRFMGMSVLYTARTPKPEQDRLGAQHCPLEELMRASDIVSVHCPLTPDTDGLIRRELILSMKPTAYLINTARGRVVDEEALMDALAQRRIAGAGIDVFTGEPNVNPQWSTMPNALLAPHVGSNTAQARREMAMAALERMMDVFSGKRPQNLLNPEVVKDR